MTARSAVPQMMRGRNRGGLTMSVHRGILLQKLKFERHRKSRESSFSDGYIAAKRRSANTKVRGRFSTKRCGPSRREARDASAALKIFVHHPKKTFATKSGAKQTSIRPADKSAFDPACVKTPPML
jgi:hypothetical protein